MEALKADKPEKTLKVLEIKHKHFYSDLKPDTLKPFKILKRLDDALFQTNTNYFWEKHQSHIFNEPIRPVLRILQDMHQSLEEETPNLNELLADARREFPSPDITQAMNRLRRVLVEQGPNPFRQFCLIEETFFPLVPDLNLTSSQLKQALFQENSDQSMLQLQSVLSDPNSSGRFLKPLLQAWKDVLSLQYKVKDPDVNDILHLFECVLYQQGCDLQRHLEIIESALAVLLPDKATNNAFYLSPFKDTIFQSAFFEDIQLLEPFRGEQLESNFREIDKIFVGSLDSNEQIFVQMLNSWETVLKNQISSRDPYSTAEENQTIQVLKNEALLDLGRKCNIERKVTI